MHSYAPARIQCMAMRDCVCIYMCVYMYLCVYVYSIRVCECVYTSVCHNAQV